MAAPLTIYNKRGGRNFTEKSLEKKLQAFFAANPDKISDFRPADNVEELKALHDYYCIETVEIIQETKSEPKIEHTHESFREAIKDSIEKPEPEKVINPLNRDEPIIRDYVKEDGFQQDFGTKQTQSNYGEPTNFRESFEIPDDTEEPQQPLNSNPRPKKDAAIDPDIKLKRRSKKKFTKYAVEATCALAGRGIVWWATKDITDEKIQELVVNDEIGKASLDMIVYLDTNTEGTVKQFFELSIVKAQDLAHFTQEEKDDLADALDDFMEFKNIKINPTIQLGVVFLGMVFDRVLRAMQNKAETSSILVQLKQIHAAGLDQRVRNTPPASPPPADTDTDTQEQVETTQEETTEAVAV